jgi:integrase
LKKAVQAKLIEGNPCEFVELPKKRRSTPRIFNRAEALAFLEAAQDNKHGLIFEFALIAGARPEEYLAIQWPDLEMERGAVSFNRTLIWRKGGGWYFDDQMKTTLSRRTILLPPPLIAKLKAHRIEQAKRMISLGSSYQRNDLVFASDEGTPLNSGNLTKRYYQKILKEARLEHRTLYSLRHSCATLLLAEGVNIKVIQERLGHSDITLTLSTYSHVLEGMQADASSKMGLLLYQTKAS